MGRVNTDKQEALSQARLRECLSYDPETGVFRRRADGREAGSVMQNGYRVIRVHYAKFLAHRLAWFYVHGEWPTEIDHVNRVKTDNRISNLRQCDRRLNMFNSGGWNAIGIKNISPKGKRHRVTIFQDRKPVFRKSFVCLGQAVKARNAVLSSLLAAGGNIDQHV